MSRFDIVISDNIRIRCECTDGHGKNPTCTVQRDIEPISDRGHVQITPIVECTKCGAAWVWGEACAPAHGDATP